MEPAWIYFIAVLVMAYFAQAVIGFGANIVAMTLGAVVFKVSHLVPVLLPVGLASVLVLALMDRRSIDWRRYATRILPFTAIGLPVGFALFVYAPVSWITRGYGLFVLVFSIWRLATMRRKGMIGTSERPYEGKRSVAWLLAGGVMQGLIVSGGPLIVIYAASHMKDRKVFRGTLNLLWLTLNTVLLVSHIWHGTLNLSTLRESVMLLPVMAVGLAAGEWTHRRISQETFRVAVFVVLVVAGAALLAKG